MCGCSHWCCLSLLVPYAKLLPQPPTQLHTRPLFSIFPPSPLWKLVGELLLIVSTPKVEREREMSMGGYESLIKRTYHRLMGAALRYSQEDRMFQKSRKPNPMTSVVHTYSVHNFTQPVRNKSTHASLSPPFQTSIQATFRCQRILIMRSTL